MLAEMLSISN